MADEPKKIIEQGAIDVPPIRRVSPIQFLREVRREMSKVTWPSWKETWLTTMMVFIMVGLAMVFFGVTDIVLGYAERLLIGATHL
jgi:preprotein translocase subunit SecE